MRRSNPAPAEQMIAALIPAPLPRARPPRPPLPHLPAPPTGPDQVEPHLDLARLDPSGRISARALLHLLGWPPGHRVTFDITRSAITATSGPAGRHTIGGTGLLAIPGAVRQLCRITAGDVVILLADPAVACYLSIRPEPSHDSSPNSSPQTMTPDRERLDAAWAALAELGVTLAGLQNDARPTLPTFDDYLPQVLAATGPGALRAYRSYWKCMTTAWGSLAIDTVTASDIQALQRRVVGSARTRRNSRDGRHAGELLIAAAAPSTTRPSPTASSRPPTAQPTGSANPAGCPAPDVR